MTIHKLFCKWKDSLDLALDIEIIVDIGLAKGEIIWRQEHFAQGSRMLQYQCEAREFTHCRLRPPHRTIPQTHGKIAWLHGTKQILQQRQSGLNSLIGTLDCWGCHALFLSAR